MTEKGIYFEELSALLEIEKQADFESYIELTTRASLAEKRTLGICWYPIVIKSSEVGRGDYLTVELERPSHQDITHQFRFGMPVSLFSNAENGGSRAAGIISHQGKDRLKITFKFDELPEWVNKGKLGIELLFDNNSYEEMFKAITSAKHHAKDDNALINVLIGNQGPSFNEQKQRNFSELNEIQQHAVNHILSANELAIVHGPPGTGKTTTIVTAIKALLEQTPGQILVTAPSNAAVDLLCDKLSDKGINVLRIGNSMRVSSNVKSATLDYKLANHEQTKEIKTLKKRANEFQVMAHKYKRNFGKAEKEQRKMLFAEAYKIRKEIEVIESYITEQAIAGAQVIATTLVGSNHHTIRHLNFDTVVIDEAGQALEPACWIPILKAKRVIFAGDHCQLPPTVKSQEASNKGLSKTLFEKCVEHHHQAVTLLEVQYRMNESIMGFSSNTFYHGKLRAHPGNAQQRILAADQPLSFIDTSGCGFDETRDGTSTINQEEASFLLQHLSAWIDALRMHPETKFPSIAVIAPYKQQVVLIQELLKETEMLQPYLKHISVDTVDAFQGQERDVVYIGLTRSNPEGNIGFLSDIRRMNVAITRARKKLVLIGDGSTLSRSTFYNNLMEYVESAGHYASAWEFIEA